MYSIHGAPGVPSTVVIDRWECRALSSTKRGWLLVYGRRKTGKTWLLRRCTEWQLYATLTSTGECIITSRGDGRAGFVGLRDCLERVARMLAKRDVLVVLDEFQRLPRRYWDFIANIHAESEGRLIACGSAMRIANEVYGKSSPLLGVFAAFQVGIAYLPDTIVSLVEHGLGEREALLWALVARDPWILAHVEPRGNPWEALAVNASRLVPVARGLVGEVFSEEERQLTRLYDTVLSLLARGVWRAAEIAHSLYSLGLVSSPHPGMATGPLKTLESMGLVERIPLWRTRGSRVYYRQRSSLLAILYSVRDAVEELGLEPSPDQLAARYGLELQFSVGELLAEAKGLRRAYSIPVGEPDIDVVLLDKRERPVWGYEVKTGALGEAEARRAIERLKRHGIPFAGLVSLVEKPPSLGDEQLGPAELVELARKAWREKRKQYTGLEAA